MDLSPSQLSFDRLASSLQGVKDGPQLDVAVAINRELRDGADLAY
jgi:hypothetical protein